MNLIEYFKYSNNNREYAKEFINKISKEELIHFKNNINFQRITLRELVLLYGKLK